MWGCWDFMFHLYQTFLRYSKDILNSFMNNRGCYPRPNHESYLIRGIYTVSPLYHPNILKFITVFKPVVSDNRIVDLNQFALPPISFPSIGNGTLFYFVFLFSNNVVEPFFMCILLISCCIHSSNLFINLLGSWFFFLTSLQYCRY